MKTKELTPLEALEKIIDTYCIDNMDKEINSIKEELILSNALKNKINRQIEMKQYRHDASNSYRIDALLTYELKERWDDMELEALTQFLLNLSGISNKLKRLEKLQ